MLDVYGSSPFFEGTDATDPQFNKFNKSEPELHWSCIGPCQSRIANQIVACISRK
jgi:hypothetical protein